jgi:hypothetical protein
MIESNENVAILPILKPCKLLSPLNFEWDMKFCFLHMKSNEVGTTLKHPETINGNVKNLSKRIKREDKGNVNVKDLSKRIKREDKGNVNLTLPLIASVFVQTFFKKN